ncbi:hypothetical protein, partial [[Ruminococcus] torques]|uniref:hypothetical protein n=1 Tax=[Ruminococcus] torques TaxID=33039 RepID=UPI001A9A61BA
FIISLFHNTLQQFCEIQVADFVSTSYTLLLCMIQGSKGHAFLACMKKHDLLTRKTPKSSHFS